MARCIPEVVHESQRQRGEADFLQRLRTELSDEWIVLHSLNLGAGERRGELEADFVLLHARGRLTLELKGGTITCEEGTWYSRNPNGRFRIKPPFHQAKTNAHEVHEHLKRIFGKDSAEAGAPYTHAVSFRVATLTPRASKHREIVPLIGEFFRQHSIKLFRPC